MCATDQYFPSGLSRRQWRGVGVYVSSVMTRPLIRLACAFAPAIHLPARSIATSPLWLKTVACGLFLRCFAPPRRAPKGEGFKTASLHGQGAEPRGRVFGRRAAAGKWAGAGTWRAISTAGDFSARSPRRQVFWDIRVWLDSFLMKGISRLTLEMTTSTFG